MWKIDFEKAFNRINWNFMKATLKETGLPPYWINLIRQCFTVNHMQLIWNEQLTMTFSPTRGVKQ